MFKIKKNKKTNNEYVLTSTGFWVRNFNININPVDINDFYRKEDYSLFMENELAIKRLKVPDLEEEISTRRKILILSDGHQFKEAIKILPNLPKDVTIIGTNRTLAKWKTDGELIKRKLDYYLVNNPYPECMMFFPQHRYFPKCIISSRTFAKFTKKYEGQLFQYSPVTTAKFSTKNKNYSQLDDYRNPICAAISLANRFKASKLVLLCCDDSFLDKRPGSIKLENNLYTYPQHLVSHGLIEGCLYWLQNHEEIDVSVADCSSGPKFSKVPYIKIENVLDFLGD